MPNLILELYSEELPADAQRLARNSCAKAFGDSFYKAGILFKELRITTGPCRVAIEILNLEKADLPQKLIKGPKVNSQRSSIEGFCRQHGVQESNLKKKEGYYYILKEQGNSDLKTTLEQILPLAISAIPWEKTMRWSDSACSWPRPLRSILCLLDTQVLNFSYHHLSSDRFTFGHKFAFLSPLKLSSSDEYEGMLRTNQVLPDHYERKKSIETQATGILAQAGLRVLLDDKLLEEVADLVEMPYVGLGKMPKQSIPPELVSTVMRVHQRYFPTYCADGSIAPHFLFVANRPINEEIQRGNERVLIARLEDAAFLYKRDLQTTPASLIQKLKNVSFDEKLGSIYDKTLRLASLCTLLPLQADDKEALKKASQFCKCDLASDVVADFGTLQGIMSYYYLVSEINDEKVALAIKEHCEPITQEDALPSSFLGCMLSLIDKMDTLCGLYLAGKRASGNKDPYGLRRLALSIARILSGPVSSVKLRDLVNASLSLYECKNPLVKADEIHDFIKARHENILSEQFAPLLVHAVVNSSKYEPQLAQNHLKSLRNFLLSPNSVSVCAAFKRVDSLFAKGNVNSAESNSAIVRELLLSKEASLMQPAALQLWHALDAHNGTLEQLEELVLPINQFLDEIKVSGSLALFRLLGAVLEQFNATLDFRNVLPLLPKCSTN